MVLPDSRLETVELKYRTISEGAEVYGVDYSTMLRREKRGAVIGNDAKGVVGPEGTTYTLPDDAIALAMKTDVGTVTVVKVSFELKSPRVTLAATPHSAEAAFTLGVVRRKDRSKPRRTVE